MTVVWYLVFFGWDWKSVVSIPQVSKEKCTQQADWLDKQYGTYAARHAYCIEGAKP